MACFALHARIFIMALVASLTLPAAFASGITSAPSEASSETSSKQVSEGTSASSSGSSPERNNFVAHNPQHIAVHAARGEGASLAVLAHQFALPEQAVAQRLRSWLQAHPQQALTAATVRTLLD